MANRLRAFVATSVCLLAACDGGAGGRGAGSQSTANIAGATSSVGGSIGHGTPGNVAMASGGTGELPVGTAGSAAGGAMAGPTATGPSIGGNANGGDTNGGSAGGALSQPEQLTASFPDLASLYEGTFLQPPALTDTDQTTDAPLLGNGDVGVAIMGGVDAMTFSVGKNEFWSLTDRRVKALGKVMLSVPGLAGASYAMQQKLKVAEVTGTFALSNDQVQTQSWVQADDTTRNLLITRLDYQGTAPQPASISLAVGQDTTMGTPGSAQDTLFLDLRADDVDEVGGYPTPRVRMATRVVGTHGTVQGESLNFTLEPGKPVWLVTGIMSNLDAAGYDAEILSTMAALDADQIAALNQSHRAYWENFWRKSFVEIPNKTLEKHFYASLYLLASASRSGEAAPGLWGNWVMKSPAWNSDYTLNYNYEAPFYMAFPTNHVELADSYDRPVTDWLDNAKTEATSNGWGGAFYRVHIGPLPDGSGDTATHNQKSCGAFAATVLIQHYYYTRDPQYAQSVFETLRQLAIFWQNYLRLDGNRYVIDNDAQHEDNENPQMNGVMSLGLLRFLLQGTIDISTALGADPTERAVWQDRLDKLSDFPTFTRDCATVFRYTEVGLDWNEGNAIGSQHIYPADQIGLSSEASLLQTARNMIAQMARWSDGNGTNTFYPAAARVGHDPTQILSHLEQWVTGNSYPNLHIHTGGGGIENLNTVPATLAEMLLQSFQGKLRVFANWPLDQDARFGDLRAHGAFLVSSDRRAGAVRYVRLFAEVGGPVTLVNPWPDGVVHVYRNGVDAGTVSGAELVLDTAAGELLHLAPDGTPYQTILDQMAQPLAE
ncbi:MAG TPA: hypothetical protein VL137_09245 [Polyangiaceae bacterium]|nr:hypothetical protein [Polyangiaceae bacterium]